MQLLFLGTGTSLGVPMIAHDAPGLNLQDSRNWRTRCSIHVVMDGLHFQVDAGQEFRLQCLWNNLRRLDYFLLTHQHSDHVLGMDDLRRFCTLKDSSALDVYGPPAALQRVAEIYPYAIRERPAERYYAAFRLVEMPPVLETPGGTVESFTLPHGPVETLGFVFTERSTGRRLAYYTDCKALTPEAFAAARTADVVVLDALQPMAHASHMSIGEAVDTATALEAPRTFLTHLTYLIDHATWSARLPETVALAHDGLRIDV